ncbi:hypothetical protein RIR_jg34361.t1 [Rhizophagus irregularis DAOM 181602=DAOM 197198]|nr:hypothetical protein RIR_jg34361.t1 [Rhizophagus irregularis DAOM 181602=DAOM 197198]
MVKLDADENCVEISTSWSFKYSLQMRAWRICRWTSRNEEDISSLLTQQGVLKRADNILSWDFDLNIEEIVDMWKKVVVYNVVCCAELAIDNLWLICWIDDPNQVWLYTCNEDVIIFVGELWCYGESGSLSSIMFGITGYWTAFSCSNLISNCLYCGLRMDVLDSLKLTLDVEAWVLYDELCVVVDWYIQYLNYTVIDIVKFGLCKDLDISVYVIVKSYRF